MPDPILLWNQVALEANRVSHTTFIDGGPDEQLGPTLSSRALAIVHLAMYDAYAGVINDPANLPRYIAVPAAPAPGASESAAIAAAAHATLVDLYPSQAPFFDLMLTVLGDPADPGHGFGVAVAQEILMDRAGDPPAAAPAMCLRPIAAGIARIRQSAGLPRGVLRGAVEGVWHHPALRARPAAAGQQRVPQGAPRGARPGASPRS